MDKKQSLAFLLSAMMVATPSALLRQRMEQRLRTPMLRRRQRPNRA